MQADAVGGRQGHAPDVRRRGLGAALTARAVAEGRERGYEVAVLGSSKLGYGVYERMGFTEICQDRVWMLPAGTKGRR